MRVNYLNNQIMFGKVVQGNPKTPKINPQLQPIIEATRNLSYQHSPFIDAVTRYARANKGNKELLQEAADAIDETVVSVGIKGNMLALVDAAKKLLNVID